MLREVALDALSSASEMLDPAELALDLLDEEDRDDGALQDPVPETRQQVRDEAQAAARLHEGTTRDTASGTRG